MSDVDGLVGKYRGGVPEEECALNVMQMYQRKD